MGGLRGSGPCYKLNASIKSWAQLAKNANLSTFDFWQFCKKGQLGQYITLSILTLEWCSLTF